LALFKLYRVFAVITKESLSSLEEKIVTRSHNLCSGLCTDENDHRIHTGTQVCESDYRAGEFARVKVIRRIPHPRNLRSPVEILERLTRRIDNAARKAVMNKRGGTPYKQFGVPRSKHGSAN